MTAWTPGAWHVNDLSYMRFAESEYDGEIPDRCQRQHTVHRSAWCDECAEKRAVWRASGSGRGGGGRNSTPSGRCIDDGPGL
jgi:hypothetical protein